MQQVSQIRWGKVLTWGLLSLGGLGGIVSALLFFFVWRQARGSDARNSAKPEEPVGLKRLDEYTVLVPPETLKSLGLMTADAKVARDSRTLPPLNGCLALDTNRLVRVHTRLPGEVVELGNLEKVNGRPLRHGDSVRAGQLLAVVWSKDLGEKKSELVDAVSRLRLDRENHERLKEARREGATSDRSVKEAERAVELDLINIARAERTLQSWRLTDAEIAAVRAEAEKLDHKDGQASVSAWARVEVRTPQAGMILEKNVAVGDIVDTSTDLFKIGDLSRLNVWIHVYEEDLPGLLKLQQSQLIPWTIRLPSRPGVEFKGRLEQISAVIDPMQHTALVTGQVDNKDGELHGQFVTATIDVGAADGELEVPAGAVVEDGKESVVLVQPNAEEPRFERRKVKVGRRFQDVIYLSEGLQPGERVVSAGAVLLNGALLGLPVR